MTDERLEQIVGNLLRIGVLLSAAVVLAGGVWPLATGGLSQPAFHDFDERARRPFDYGSAGPKPSCWPGFCC